MKCILKRNPDERFDINQVLQHRAITDNLSNFSRPLTAEEYKVMITNYMINCGKSVIRDMPDEVRKLREEISEGSNRQKDSEKIIQDIKMDKENSFFPSNKDELGVDSKTANFFAEVLPKTQVKFDQPMFDKLPENFFDFKPEQDMFKKPAKNFSDIKLESTFLLNPSCTDQKQLPNQEIKNSLGSSNGNRSQSKAKQVFRIEHATAGSITNPLQQTINRSLFSNSPESKLTQPLKNQVPLASINDHEQANLTVHTSNSEVNHQGTTLSDNQTSFFTQHTAKPPEYLSIRHVNLNENVSIGKSVTFINHPLSSEFITETSNREVDFSTQPTENVNYFPYDVHDISKSTVFNNLEKMTRIMTVDQKSEVSTPLRRTNTLLVPDNQKDKKPKERDLSANIKKTGMVRYVLKDGVLVPQSNRSSENESTPLSLPKEARSYQNSANKGESKSNFQETNKVIFEVKTSQGLSYQPVEPVKTISARFVKPPNLTFINYNDVDNPRANNIELNKIADEQEARVPTFNPYSPEPPIDGSSRLLSQYSQMNTSGSHKDVLKEPLRLKSASNHVPVQETPLLLGYIRKAS